MPRKLIVGLLMATLLAGGCAGNSHSHSGELIAEHTPDSTPEVTEVPYRATYALYQWAHPPEGPPPRTWIPEHEVTELYVRGLSGSDKVGFEKGENGELRAVAGDEKIPLEPGHYCWHITPETEHRGLERAAEVTGDTVCTVVALPFATVAYICALPIFAGLFGIGMLCCP